MTGQENYLASDSASWLVIHMISKITISPLVPATTALALCDKLSYVVISIYLFHVFHTGFGIFSRERAAAQ